jgi:hypothetical protein
MNSHLGHGVNVLEDGRREYILLYLIKLSLFSFQMLVVVARGVLFHSNRFKLKRTGAVSSITF